MQALKQYLQVMFLAKYPIISMFPKPVYKAATISTNQLGNWTLMLMHFVQAPLTLTLINHFIDLLIDLILKTSVKLL